MALKVSDALRTVVRLQKLVDAILRIQDQLACCTQQKLQWFGHTTACQ